MRISWTPSGAVIADTSSASERRERFGTALDVSGTVVASQRCSAIGHAKGALHRLRPPPAGEPLDDAGLAHKVESVLFRDPRVPKGEISINAEGGTVFLRGQLESAELIDDVGKAVRKIRDVEKVVNLLHLPGTEAPHPAGHPLTRSVR